MQAEKWLALIKCAQAHEKKKMKNIDMKYEKRGRKKVFFSYSFFCMFGESKWKTKWYTTRWFSFCFLWPSGLRRCSKNRKVPGSIPTRRSAGLWDPTSLRGSRWPSGRKCKTQWLTSGEWGCPLDNGPKLAMGQPNSSLKKKKILYICQDTFISL